MVFWVRKFIEALLLPVGLSGLLVVTGIVLKRRLIAIAGVVLLYLLSTPFVGGLILRPLENICPPLTVAAAPGADAVVVLSGSNVRGVTPAGVQWGDTSNRYFAGLALARAGKAPLLVLTSGAIDDPRNPNQALLLKQDALSQGILPDRIVVTRPVATTEDEARAIAEIPAIHSILLVTSAVHLPRATLLFRRQGFKVTPFPTDQRVWKSSEVTSLEFIPGFHGLQWTEMAMREYYGTAVYRLLFLFRGSGR
jgi:uncharacterized SAM-binding protein YcdF (DUF218 family)